MRDADGRWIHDTKSPEQHLLDAGLVTHACGCGARCSYDPNRPKDAPKMKCGHCGKAFGQESAPAAVEEKPKKHIKKR